ncbi:hypothetical protein MYX07_01405 [Patescibacteria group bacterium AH-259-L07]|nr:hypothetical protein [Patescibacteria group bacterium AH-259-L07]
MKNLLREIRYSRTAQIIGAIVLVVLIIVLAPFAMGIVATLGLLVLIAIVIYFGSLRELAGSVVVVLLMKMLREEITELLSIWFVNPKITQTIDFLVSTGYIKSILVVFFIVFSISLLTGSVKLLRFNNSVTTQAKSD